MKCIVCGFDLPGEQDLCQHCAAIREEERVRQEEREERIRLGKPTKPQPAGQ